MALKRKQTVLDSVANTKKIRRGIFEHDEYTHTAREGDEYEIPEHPIEPHEGDAFRYFKQDGELRADRESRYEWRFLCEVEGCGRRFNRPCRLEAHMQQHTGERPFVCPHDDCDRTYPRKEHLQRHIKTFHEEPERNFVCDHPGCDKKFFEKRLLTRHKKAHETKYHCTGFPPCIREFRKKKTLDAHIRSVHLGAYPHPCPYMDEETGGPCTSAYEAECSLRRHVDSVHRKIEKEPKYFCLLCPVPGTEGDISDAEDGLASKPKHPLTFTVYHDFLAHQREAHPPVCTQCGRRFTGQVHLKEHIDIVHGTPDTVPKFPCTAPGCTRSFTRVHNLRVHISAVHEKKRNWVCGEFDSSQSKHAEIKEWDGHGACGDAFGAKSSLEQHIRTQHLDKDNRKVTRKAKKPQKPRNPRPKPSVLSLLTGVGYEANFKYPCALPDCPQRYHRIYDLEQHLLNKHGLPEDTVEEMITECETEQEARNGGQFWIGGSYTADSRFMSIDPSHASTTVATPSQADFQFGTALQAEQGIKMPEAQMLPPDPIYPDVDWDMNDADMDAEMGLTNLPRVSLRGGYEDDTMSF